MAGEKPGEGAEPNGGEEELPEGPQAFNSQPAEPGWYHKEQAAEKGGLRGHHLKTGETLEHVEEGREDYGRKQAAVEPAQHVKGGAAGAFDIYPFHDALPPRSEFHPDGVDVFVGSDLFTLLLSSAKAAGDDTKAAAFAQKL